MVDVQSYAGASSSIVANREEAVVVFRQGTDPTDDPVKCSGTYIGNSLVLSAAHCVVNDDPIYAGAGGWYAEFSHEFNPLTGLVTSGAQYGIQSIVERGTGQLGYDYVVFRLSSDPGISPTPLNVAHPFHGEPYLVIGHPKGHPLGSTTARPKVIGDGTITAYSSLHPSNTIVSPYPFGPELLRHNVDTKTGSSGSGVLDQDGMLYAIHGTGGQSDYDPSGANVCGAGSAGAVPLAEYVHVSDVIQAQRTSVYVRPSGNYTSDYEVGAWCYDRDVGAWGAPCVLNPTVANFNEAEETGCFLSCKPDSYVWIECRIGPGSSGNRDFERLTIRRTEPAALDGTVATAGDVIRSGWRWADIETRNCSGSVCNSGLIDLSDGTWGNQPGAFSLSGRPVVADCRYTD